jgi:hypothetical protein
MLLLIEMANYFHAMYLIVPVFKMKITRDFDNQ